MIFFVALYSLLIFQVDSAAAGYECKFGPGKPAVAIQPDGSTVSLYHCDRADNAPGMSVDVVKVNTDAPPQGNFARFTWTPINNKLKLNLAVTNRCQQRAIATTGQDYCGCGHLVNEGIRDSCRTNAANLQIFYLEMGANGPDFRNGCLCYAGKAFAAGFDLLEVGEVSQNTVNVFQNLIVAGLPAGCNVHPNPEMPGMFQCRVQFQTMAQVAQFCSADWRAPGAVAVNQHRPQGPWTFTLSTGACTVTVAEESGVSEGKQFAAESIVRSNAERDFSFLYSSNFHLGVAVFLISIAILSKILFSVVCSKPDAIDEPLLEQEI